MTTPDGYEPSPDIAATHTKPSHETPMYNFEGDPAFQERKFVDTTPYIPPWMVRDAFTKEPRTYADETIEEVESPGYVAAINVPGAVPGESEYSWGAGNANSLSKGPGPTQLEIIKATQRTNPADGADTYEAHLTDEGWAQP
jgi:hypothetical protein